MKRVSPKSTLLCKVWIGSFVPVLLSLSSIALCGTQFVDDGKFVGFRISPDEADAAGHADTTPLDVKTNFVPKSFLFATTATIYDKTKDECVALYKEIDRNSLILEGAGVRSGSIGCWMDGDKFGLAVQLVTEAKTASGNDAFVGSVRNFGQYSAPYGIWYDEILEHSTFPILKTCKFPNGVAECSLDDGSAGPVFRGTEISLPSMYAGAPGNFVWSKCFATDVNPVSFAQKIKENFGPAAYKLLLITADSYKFGMFQLGCEKFKLTFKSRNSVTLDLAIRHVVHCRGRSDNKTCADYFPK